MVQPGRQVGIRTRFVKWLQPMDVSSQEIRALDGIRTIAALLVLTFHAISNSSISFAIGGHKFNYTWSYAQSGVHLFFVLSGFLLFLPYARSMLSGKTWPSAWAFYKRRALRILPAYYACLTILVVLRETELRAQEGNAFIANIGLHVLLLHNLIPEFNISRGSLGIACRLLAMSNLNATATECVTTKV